MKRFSPDAGRRRVLRREAMTSMDLVPHCATGLLAAATLAVATFTAPGSLSGSNASVETRCDVRASHEPQKDGTRG
ncbi:hypothetical protein LJR143_002387 [Pseudoxanthomonas sp. LjRoot143]|uniref:hypothetical protein n=1 Tax=Pseudoxanthomonas sp. LjRoot143 TaxID=3342266 RepID=UPI003ECD1E39